MTHLFVSDLHLDAAAPEASDQFIGWLRGEARLATALYILGDLFESWVGDDDDDAERARVCEALRDYTDGGVPCFVMHGNRDFLLGERFAAHTGCRLIADPVIAVVHGVRTLLAHGDLFCTDDVKYQQLRTIVRSPVWQRRLLAMSLADRKLLADEARAGSRAHTSRVVPEIMDANPAAIEKLVRHLNVDVVIHGHTHRPGVHDFNVDGRPRTRIVLGAWYEQGSVLEWSVGGQALRTLAR
ncbi:MAG TPA: UDP-2,3-diacylglucosamine diphosphatase [Steroidobacteraceae bacterium]|nr:UDP-2,3-diacylglucosamine diphosphatase [Steroidobacteraceae bacterium]HNS27945.1 UDP-2,3-diacylglucosamine diphosphatase [Steroidobacteraceae bacterium]